MIYLRQINPRAINFLVKLSRDGPSTRTHFCMGKVLNAVIITHAIPIDLATPILVVVANEVLKVKKKGSK